MDPFRRQATLLLTALTLAAAQAALAAGPSFHHHDDGDERGHYKDEGEKPARAQAGATFFQSRALIGKSGVTDLEVTTGVLDSTATPPGYLTEVHVKAFRLDGKHQFEKEFEHLRRGGGYAKFSFPLPDGKRDTRLQRGQRLRLEVQGRGLPSGDEGEAEAKLENVVKYRPDLTVTSLQYPAVARPNIGVDIVATVAEAMRDTGAHADCVLSVDGVAVDTVPHIWVDANGTVSCHFNYTFTVVGQHTLLVSLNNVVPGDYDTDNNSLSGTIKIENPAVLAYTAAVIDLKNGTRFVQDTYATASSTAPDQHLESTSMQHTQARSLRGTIPAAVNLPLRKVSYADQSDGAPLSSVIFSDLAADATRNIVNPSYDTLSVIARFDRATAAWFTMSRYVNSSTGAGYTEVTWSFFGGDVTFHSEGYCKSIAGIFTCAGGDWTSNATGGGPLGGAIINLGANYAADVLVDDGTAYQAHPAMPLVTRTNNSGMPLSCQTSAAPPPYKVCTLSTASSSVTSGSAVFTPPSM